MVAEQRDNRVDWRFVSLRILNAHIDYDARGHVDAEPLPSTMSPIAPRPTSDSTSK